ncbi:hypothetical protein EST38_g14364 [Candolleomyces aberdarensis]|uniref:Uncharacterized protein n=1 Tax=Candolleomyces aberdarensis TaxID=2316362 RepID=A0A4Q2CZV7_9AGAR|nr:hypothetical protein EST38_g14364 [Candolleomyces aberdarensis]
MRLASPNALVLVLFAQVWASFSLPLSTAFDDDTSSLSSREEAYEVMDIRSILAELDLDLEARSLLGSLIEARGPGSGTSKGSKTATRSDSSDNLNTKIRKEQKILKEIPVKASQKGPMSSVGLKKSGGK